MGRSEGSKPLGRPRSRWKDNIKIDLRDVSCDAGNCMNVAKEGINDGFM